jgi:flotillin
MVFDPIGMAGGALGLYKIVPVNEAHVVIRGNNKEVFMSRKKSKVNMKGELEPDKEDYRPAYWYVPFITRVTRLPLVNLRIDVPDVKLNDKNMAKFMCDVVVFVNIDDPILAAERTDITVSSERYEGVDAINEDFRSIMESIMRTTATKQPIIDMYMNRQALDEAITKEIGPVFSGWGLRLVDLEIKDIKDTINSTIIQDIEKKNAAQINADARCKVAEETKRAEIAEATNKKEAEMVKAENEQLWRQRQIQKDREIGVAEQDQAKMVAMKQQEANTEAINARRKLEVGGAEVEKEATIQRATGVKQKITLEAEGDAAKIQAVGTSEANVVKLKKVADAEGTEKLALAQQKFNDAATVIETIKANKEVGLEYAKAYAAIGANAKINIVNGASQDILSGGILGNIKIGPKEGAALQQFIDTNPELAEKIIGQLFPKKDVPKDGKKV